MNGELSTTRTLIHVEINHLVNQNVGNDDDDNQDLSACESVISNK